MPDKLTNSEILTQIAEMSDEERNNYGVTSDMQAAALKAAGGNRAAAASFFAGYTPLYNAFVGFVVKFALSALSKASYDDLYAAHHRNMTQGRPQLGFVKPAKKGTGNSSKQFADDPAIGGLTTVTTADMPDVVALYDITPQSYEARVPVSIEDVKTAFNNEYGINDLYVKVREGLEDAIIEDRNTSFDDAFSDIIEAMIPVGSGSEIAANAAKATYAVVPGGADWEDAADTGDLSQITDDQLTQVFVAIKRHLFEIMGRPETTHNALGEKNNKKDNLVCYVWAPLYAEMSRVKASAFNVDELLDRGVSMKPLSAPWLGYTTDAGLTTLVALGSADYIRDFPTSDFGKTVECDRGVIECRFMDTQLAIAGYEPFTFLVGGASSFGYPITKVTPVSTTATIHVASFYANTADGSAIKVATASASMSDIAAYRSGVAAAITRGTSTAGSYAVTIKVSDGTKVSTYDAGTVNLSSAASVALQSGNSFYDFLRANYPTGTSITLAYEFEAV